MGLAEPRKRLKISHDPNNLKWSSATDSYGQRVMQMQGWKAGEGLGAVNRRGFNSYDNAKVKIFYKDNNLGLGATLKSQDVEHSRTGLDAFQGLLGRLNGKSDLEIEQTEKKAEDRKLAMFAQGKWGSMVFVPGGLLEQRDDFKLSGPIDDRAKGEKPRNDAEAIANMKRKQKGGDGETNVQDAERAERKQRKEDRRKRKAEKAAKKNADSSAERINANLLSEKKSEQRRSHKTSSEASLTSEPEMKTSRDSTPAPSNPRPTIRNGRHLLRGRNIAAKKMAFADAKMLDEIFMKTA